MKKFLILFLILIESSLIYAQNSSEWFRYASISPDGKKIAFTYKGDIYTIPSNGGNATAITFHKAHDYMPVWSNDGKKISFASNRFGNFDVFIVDANGGEAKRLTYHSNPEVPYTFTNNDEEIVFGGARLDNAEHRQFPTGSQPEVYKISVGGGNLTQMWTIPAEDIKISNDGNKVIYHDKKAGENVFRKHHKSSVTRDIWLYNKLTGKHKKVTSFYGEDRNPVYSIDDKSIFYLSEKSGTFNIYKLNLTSTSESKVITNFKKHPVRYLSISNNGLLCFTHNGNLYTLVEGSEPKLVNVKLNVGLKSNNEKIIPINGNVSEMAVSPNGKEIAYIVRGEIFVSSSEYKMTKRITSTPAQERFVSFSPDGRSLIYASERNAKWSIYETKMQNKVEPYFFASTVLKETPVIENNNNNYQPSYSPDGEKIAYIENRTELKIFNISNQKTDILLTGNDLYYMQEGDQYFKWSPDSKWLLVEYKPVMANSELLLIAVDGSEKVNLTESGYGDYNPMWVDEGRQLIWFSDRHGLRSYAKSGDTQLDVYAMFLTKDEWDKFNLSKAEYALWKELEEKDKKEESENKDKKKKKTNEVEDSNKIFIDWDGLRERKQRLTIHSSDLNDAVLSKDGEHLYYLAKFEKGINLWSTNLRTKETKMLIPVGAKKGSLKWDKEMTTLFLLADGKIFTLDTKAKKKKIVNIKEEMALNIEAEREHMFEHVWQRTNSMFYTSNYHGINWDEMKANYQPKVSSIGNGFEFAEILSEMLGELNVSHCGARMRYSDPLGDKTASLGIFIDYSYSGEGIKIDEIIKGGPMDKAGLEVSEGMIIKRINGEMISSKIDYAKYLNRIGGKLTAINVYNPETKKYHDFTIKPVSINEEQTLLYKRWVRKNEEEVAILSNNKLGYIHIPYMMDVPYRNIYEKVMGKYYDSEALIVDTRFNGGGDLVGDLTMFLTGEKFIEYTTEERALGSEPVYRWTKPSIAMVNEGNYSDGHCFACAYKDLNIGKMVGMPVPGTCSYAGWEVLQNGKIFWGSVPVSAKNKAGEWMENNETTPHYKLKNMPGIINKGRDQQLEKAVEVLMKEIE